MKLGLYDLRKKFTFLVFSTINIFFVVWLSDVIYRLFIMDLQSTLFGAPKAVVKFSFILLGLVFLLILYRLIKSQVVQKWARHFSFPIILFVIAFVPRLLWMLALETTVPFSDYALYMKIANSIASAGTVPDGDRWYITFAPYVLGYASFLASLFSVFGNSIVVPQIVNAVMSGLIAVFLFLMGKKITGRLDIGLLAAAIIIVLPSQIAMTLFPGTELPYITLMIATFYVCLFISDQRARINRYLLVVLASLLLVMMNEIRPLGILTLFSFFIFFILTNRFTKRTMLRNISVLALFVIIYLGATSALNTVKDQFLGMPVARNAYGFGLLLGMNYDTVGKWSPEDSNYLAISISKGQTAQQFHHDMIELAYQRYLDLLDRGLIFDLINKKIAIFWSDPMVFVDWTPLLTKDTVARYFILKTSYHISIALYSLIIIFSLMETIFSITRKDYAHLSKTLMVKIILIATVAMHSVFDINPRYISPAIPLLILLAASGFHSTENFLAHKLQLKIRKPLLSREVS